MGLLQGTQDATKIAAEEFRLRPHMPHSGEWIIIDDPEYHRKRIEANVSRALEPDEKAGPESARWSTW